MNTVRIGIMSARGPKRIMPRGRATEEEAERSAITRPIILSSVLDCTSAFRRAVYDGVEIPMIALRMMYGTTPLIVPIRMRQKP